MIIGTVYRMNEKQHFPTSLGWQNIKVVDYRIERTVSYKTQRNGFVSSIEKENIATSVRTDYEYAIIGWDDDKPGSTQAMWMPGSELEEDLCHNYDIVYCVK